MNRWLIATSRCVTIVALGVLPALLVTLLVAVVATTGAHGSDFWTFWDAGRAVLHGRSPYPTLQALPHAATRTFAPFVYPPVAAVLFVPLALLPYAVAKLVFLVLSLAALGLALRLLGVTDWRCYGAAFASVPVYASIGNGTISLFLLLLVAAAWRFRERVAAVALLIAAAITAKVFLWPLWLWLVRTRRLRAAAFAVVASMLAVAISWSVIGFAGLREYPTLLSRLTGLVGPHSYSLYAFERALGLGHGTAQAAVYLAGAIGLAILVFVRDDRRVFVAALALSLVVTPILWPHYLVLLFVPIALAARSFTVLWIAPLALWLDATAWNRGAVSIAGLFVMSGAIVLLSGRRDSNSGPLVPQTSALTRLRHAPRPGQVTRRDACTDGRSGPASPRAVP